MSPKKCRFGATDCTVLSGFRALEICLSCKMISHGTSLENGKELMTPLHFVATPKPKPLTPSRRMR